MFNPYIIGEENNLWGPLHIFLTVGTRDDPPITPPAPMSPAITADTELHTKTVYVKHTGDTNVAVLFYRQSANRATCNGI